MISDKERQPSGKGWELWNHPDARRCSSIYNWRLRGDVDLDLAIQETGLSGKHGVIFEMAKFISDPIVARAIINEGELPSAMEDIGEGKSYPYCYWRGDSPDDVKKHFQETRLPLPNNLEQAFERSIQIVQAQRTE